MALSKEQNADYLAALVHELAGAEVSLARVADHADATVRDEAKAYVADVKAELARIGGGAEPRNKNAK